MDVVRAGTALFASPARLAARRVLRTLRSMVAVWAEARAEQRLWEAAHLDPRLYADLAPSRKPALADDRRFSKASGPAAATAEPARPQASRWERFIELAYESRRCSGQNHLYH